MIRVDGQPILTAAAMRAAEELAAPTPDAMYDLMERAGAGVAAAVRRVAIGQEVLVLCGPGNNGGDGYVAARILRDGGVPVRIAALTPPRTALARRAAAAWEGPVTHYTTGNETFDDGREPWNHRPPEPAPVLVDALFGAGSRDRFPNEPWVPQVQPLFDGARYVVAVDLPLGVSATDRANPWQDFACPDLTLAIGALKPAHVLAETRAICGQIRVIDLGLDLAGASVRAIDRPPLLVPDRKSHKYNRGMVGVVAGTMPGAARLAAAAAARAGAGYVALYGDAPGGPDAIVHRPLTREALSDKRLDCIVIGPGLGRNEEARDWLRWLVEKTWTHLVIDGDALHLFDPAWLEHRSNVVLTPHAGEHRVLTAGLAPDLVDPADPFGTSMRQARALMGGHHVMVAKGATTVVADGFAAIVASGGNPWLSTAGTGDVLAGAIGAMVASARHRQSRTVFEAAAAGVWLHAEAARRCGASFIADDLAYALTAARASI